MKAFEFTGVWKFNLELDKFSDLFSFNWMGDSNNRREIISFQIIDVKNENPEPEIEQINAINFILNNEELITRSIYKVLEGNIVPKFKTSLGEDDEIFLKLDSLEDLENYLGIGNVLISNLFKNDSAYYTIYFNSFRCNQEHGLSLIFHKDRFIGTDENFKEAYEDLGLNYSEIMKEVSFNHQKKMENRSFEFYRPKIANGVLKPWQISENSVYLSRLLHTDQRIKFIEFMNTNESELDYNWKTLHSLAENYGFEDVVKYLETIK